VGNLLNTGRFLPYKVDRTDATDINFLRSTDQQSQIVICHKMAPDPEILGQQMLKPVLIFGLSNCN